MTKQATSKETVEVKYNGKIYLARDLEHSTQYLGSGATKKAALEDMEHTLSWGTKMKALGTKTQFTKWLEEDGDTWEGFLNCDYRQQKAFIDLFNEDVEKGLVG